MDKATKSLFAETCLCKAKLREGIAALKVLLDSALFTAEADTIIQLFKDGWESLQRLEQLLISSAENIINEEYNKESFSNREKSSEKSNDICKIEEKDSKDFFIDNYDPVDVYNSDDKLENGDDQFDYGVKIEPDCNVNDSEVNLGIELRSECALAEDEDLAQDLENEFETNTKHLKQVSLKSTEKYPKTAINKKIKVPLNCDLCSSEFSSKKDLTLHRRTEHRPHTCITCQKGFSTRHQLKAHSQIHANIKMFKCEVCSKDFVSASNLYTHKFVHADRKFQCDVCSNTFLRKSDLQKHMFIHTGEKPFKCEYCSLETAFKGTMIEHVRTHTGEKPYKCDICPKAFRVKTGLNAHLRRHAGIKPYKCDVCAKDFDSKSHLSTHNRIHTGEKPFSCEVCAKSFTRRANLREHMNTHQR